MITSWLLTPDRLFSRYKMTCEYTWPNHLMASDRDAVEAIITQHGFQDDVAYGHTKLFVRTPRSLFTLEQERAALIPILVLFLQKVGLQTPGRGFIDPTALIRRHGDLIH